MKTPRSRKEKTSCPKDTRFFSRLTSNHEWRKLSPAGIREIVVKKLSILPPSISMIKPVRSGFAPSPRNDETRQELLKGAILLSPFDAKLEAESNWTPIMVLTVPKSIQTLEGKLEVTKEMLSNEIKRVSLVRPASLRLFGRKSPEDPHRTWMAYFSEASRPGFRVFDESGIVIKFKKRQTLDFCNRYSRKCLARLARAGKPTKEQLKTFRQAGDREYQAIIRARIAEERATTIQRDMKIIADSQSENIITDNSLASSVESSTDNVRRL
ncbi:putative eka-like protein [Erysiphe necator]|uniref:Putative eka-like protein n=1 Tax=Uncinula necator TaxID=52586 RepID=A0A0B1P5V2_UNCNE|nr:putative eka-like protein [Erysiphe necator]